MKVIQIKIDNETYDKIQQLAAQTGNIKMATMVKILLSSQLNSIDNKK